MSQTPKPITKKRSSLMAKAFRASTNTLPSQWPPTSPFVSKVSREPDRPSYEARTKKFVSLTYPKLSSLQSPSTKSQTHLFDRETTSPQQSLSVQPSANYLQSSRAISHESAKENIAPPDAREYDAQRRQIEELRAEIGTLKFSLNSLEQENELRALHHDQEMRDVQAQREQDFKRRQEMEAERDTALRRLEIHLDELESLRTGVSEDKTGLEKKLRQAHDSMRLLQEQIEDLSTAKEAAETLSEHRSNENKAQALLLERRVEELERDRESHDAELAQLQEQLHERDTHIAKLEADVLRLKAQTGDAETIAIIRKELTEQVQHIRALEASNRNQLMELKHLRQVTKSVGILEEEKRSLQKKVQAAESVEKELHESHIQRKRLEDEKKAWTLYLARASEDEDMKFDSPEAMAKALVEERIRSASLLSQEGMLKAEVAERDSTIEALHNQTNSLLDELEKAKAGALSGVAPEKIRVRAERQRALLVKEVEYLRAQLKTFDSEDVTMNSGTLDEQKEERIGMLEGLVDRYKQELETMQQELANAQAARPTSQGAHAGSKRRRTDNDDDGNDNDNDNENENENSSGYSDVDNKQDLAAAGAARRVRSERLGQLQRKNRVLADELSASSTRAQVLEKELVVARERLRTLEEQSRTRILALRSNPTADYQAVQQATLDALRRENAELMSYITDNYPSSARVGGGNKPTKSGSVAPGSTSAKYRTVPYSLVTAAQRETAEAQAEAASTRKTMSRLKQVWAGKSAEFREAIFSTLGWTVTFIPNGKMRVESVFYPSRTDDHENSIVFDGERGTMKISGGPKSPFARKIAAQVKFWVREKNSIPGFLAALTLEFFDEAAAAAAVTAAGLDGEARGGEARGGLQLR